MAAPNRVRRGGRRAPAGSSLLTRPASPCPTRTVAMGKDSSRGVTIHRRRGRAIGRSERPGRGGGGPPGVAMATRAPARHPCAPPGLGPGCWRPLDGRGAASFARGRRWLAQSRGWRTGGWGRGAVRCRAPEARPAGGSAAGWGRRGTPGRL